MRTALIVVDMINDFVTGKLGFAGAQKIVPNIRGLLDSARANRVPVVYVSDAHSPRDAEISVWGRHAIAGTGGAQIIPELEPMKGEPVFRKQTYSIFNADEPRALLKKKGVKGLVLTGVVTDICIQNSAAGAFFNGYAVVIPADCVAAPDKKAHRYSLAYMERVFGVKITNSMEITKGWEK